MDKQLEYVFSPLNSVDRKSLTKIADSLKNSKKKNEKAVGVFLARVIQYRSGEIPADNDSPLSAGTGLRDLF